jgi:hypothetical protein
MLLADAADAPRFRARVVVRPIWWRRLSPGWPLWATLVLYPIWWGLGLGSFAFILAAIPMAWTLLRSRPIRIPPVFGIWLVFIFWNALSLVMLPAHAPHTAEGSTTGRIISLMLRFIDLATASVFLLYVVNLSKDVISQRQIVRWMSILFLITVGGGLLALAIPNFEFNSPFERILPHFIAKNVYVQTLVHPAAAQVQDVLGFAAPRPAAPWAYTNTWGNSISLLIVWFCVYMWHPKVAKNHVRMVLILLVALVTIVYSLNRGLWFGLILSVMFIIGHLSRKGDFRATLYAIGAIAVGGVLFVVTPLNHVVQQRAANGKSNSIRAFVDSSSFRGATQSPLLGWGDSRKVLGSSQSIAVGPSPQCPQCGEVNLGSAGEIWLIMFDNGLAGAAVYLLFFGAVWWRLRASPTVIGAAGRLTVILTVFYTVFYNNLPTSLILSMLSIAIAFRDLPDRPGQVAPAITA